MSIQSMINATPSGGTVNVAPGIYFEQLMIDKPLTLQGPDPSIGKAIVDATGLGSAPTLLITSNQVTVKLLTFQNGPGQGIRVGTAAFPNLEEVLIENCTIQGHDLAGILNIDSSAINVIGNIIENNGTVPSFQRAGVLLYPHGKTNVANNYIHNNGDNSDGVFARASNAGLLIENNVIENEFNSGITLAWDEQNVTIRGNIIKNCGSDNDELKSGIVVVQSMAETISGNTITNCKQRAIMWTWVPTVGSEPDEILITSNQINHSSYDGIYLFSQGPGSFMPPDPYPLKPLISKNLINENTGAGLFVSNAFLGNPTGTANPRLECNSIQSNSWGAYNQTATVIDAVNNWWGDSSGPLHPVTNPEGLGNPVSDRIDFIPWCTSPPLAPTTKIDCIEATKVYWGCKKNLVSKRVADVSEIAAGKVVEVKCPQVNLVDDPMFPVTVGKIPGTDWARIGFYFKYSLLFKDSTGWKVINNPPVFHEEVFILPTLDPRFDLSADIYLRCLQCFVSDDYLVTCCICKTILLQLVSKVQLLIPTYGFAPEPPNCQQVDSKCLDYNSVYSLPGPVTSPLIF